jgi:hypothetical protein
LVAVDDAFAPDGFEIGEWLFRGGFLGGFSGRFQFLNAIARSDEHVPGFREVRFVAERSVPRNNLGVVVRERENSVGSGDHTVDIAARTGVDVGIRAVEKRVGLCERLPTIMFCGLPVMVATLPMFDAMAIASR